LPVKARLARPQRLFLWALALLLALFLWQCRDGLPLSFDLLALLPQNSAQDDLQRLAGERVQQPLSRQVLALVSHEDSAKALEAAKWLAQCWQDSGLFARVELSPEIDLEALRRQLRAQRLALLPAAVRAQLLQDPQAYMQMRAAQLSNPFASGALVALAQDWLGLAQQAQGTLQAAPAGKLHYDLASGTLQVTGSGETQILLRAQTQGDAFDTQAAQGSLLEHIEEDRTALAELGAQLLVAGGPLYAEQGRRQATSEISLIGSLSVLGIVALLLLTLRHVRALLALLPVLVGLFCGVVACVLVFGSIHILTLVIGASLIGVAVDFPLHWLGKSYAPGWQGQTALRAVLPGLSMSLAASLVGYLALLFTPFIALSQTAVFSAFGLLAAYACTLWLMPALLGNWQPRPWPPLLQLAQRLLALRRAFCERKSVLLLSAALLLAATCGGLARLSLHDDLRQWLSLPPALLGQMQQIGEKSGLIPSGQFFLLRAVDEDSLLRKQAQLARELDRLVQRGELGSYNALSQLLAPLSEQRRLQAQLAALAQQPQVFRPLLGMGVDFSVLQQELLELQQLPPVTLNEALQKPSTERWHGLWLGTRQGQSAALVTLFNLRAVEPLRTIDIHGVTLVDRSGELNQMFSATRVKAGELKLLSYLAAALLLWWGLGRAAVWRILCVPLLAVVLSLAVLGWLGLPLTLFSLFGLLLVSALGVDYAIFMYEGVGGAAVSLVGVLLSAATTLLSFGLLALSQTPVIAGFGLSVALGVGFSLLLALWVKK